MALLNHVLVERFLDCAPGFIRAAVPYRLHGGNNHRTHHDHNQLALGSAESENETLITGKQAINVLSCCGINRVQVPRYVVAGS